MEQVLPTKLIHVRMPGVETGKRGEKETKVCPYTVPPQGPVKETGEK
jgi:hypothetical protein